MAVDIAVESPLQDVVRSLVAELDAGLPGLTAPQPCNDTAVERMANDACLKRLVLEIGDRNPAASAVYEGAGFSRCGPALDHPYSSYSVFYEKALAS